MAILRMLFMTVVPAVVLACVIGLLVGRHQVKKAAGQLKPLLTQKERIIYAPSITIGVICLAVGIFYQPPARMPDQGDMGMMMPDHSFGGQDFVNMDGGMEFTDGSAIADDITHDFEYGEHPNEQDENPYDEEPAFEEPALEDPANWVEAAPEQPVQRPANPPATAPRPAPGGGGGSVVIVR